MGPQEAKKFFTEHLEERRRSYDDRKLTPGGEGFMGVYYPNPLEIGNQVKDYSLAEWATANGKRIENEKKEERTMVNQTCENCIHKGVCKHQEIFENICKNENLFAGVEVFLGENRYGRLTNLDFIELHRPTCKHFLPKNFTGIR